MALAAGISGGAFVAPTPDKESIADQFKHGVEDLKREAADLKAQLKEALDFGRVEKSKFPTYEKMMEAKKEAPHRVQLEITTEVAQRAWDEVFPDGFDIKKIAEYEKNNPNFRLIEDRNNRHRVLDKMPFKGGEPQILMDKVKGKDDEYLIIIRTNKNWWSGKNPVVACTVKMNAEGQPMFKGDEYKGRGEPRGVFALMTEAEFHRRAKSKTEDGAWLRGESTSADHIKKTGLVKRWEKHDGELTLKKEAAATERQEEFRQLMETLHGAKAEVTTAIADATAAAVEGAAEKASETMENVKYMVESVYNMQITDEQRKDILEKYLADMSLTAEQRAQVDLQIAELDKTSKKYTAAELEENKAFGDKLSAESAQRETAIENFLINIDALYANIDNIPLDNIEALVEEDLAKLNLRKGDMVRVKRRMAQARDNALAAKAQRDADAAARALKATAAATPQPVVETREDLLKRIQPKARKVRDGD